MTSYLSYPVLPKKTKMFNKCNVAVLKEVNCTDPFPSVSIPWSEGAYLAVIGTSPAL